MEPPPTRTCSCGSPSSSPRLPHTGTPPPKPDRNRKRPGGTEPSPPPKLSPSPHRGKRPRRKGEGDDTPPSEGDRLFAQKCRELRGFIRPLAELLEGLKQGRYDRGLSSFQQSVAMDRIQRIIGVLQKPQMGARYLGTLLQVEGMLRVWFPHVAPKLPPRDLTPPPASTTATPNLRRRPPAGPPGAPRCRRPPARVTPSSTGTLHRGGPTGTTAPPPAPDA